MRFISTRMHGALDYLTGALLIIAPWMMKFGRGGAETWIMLILGAGAILYSLLTDYEWGMAKVFSMRTHLTFDLLSGILLAASPWLFGFSEHVFWPHVVLGVFEIGASLMTQTTPSRGAAEHSRPM
ncbi:MAG: SPW repeat protein [Cytophagales bacterium]|jgi:hypothetical protein|nr:SPW repeat protein [Cytophagales bacterium]